jgi:YVTN family beta-propeller protein
VSSTGAFAGDVYAVGVGGGGVVIDPATNTVVATLPTSGGNGGVAVSSTGAAAGDIFVANTFGGNTVSVIDPATNTVVGTIETGVQPRELAISSTGYVYVANATSGTVSVINPNG